jgi:type I restriction enzyme M protein
MHKNKQKRKGEVLFIDARNLGHLVTRKNRDLADADITNVADTYHNWLADSDNYADIQGFCKSATLDEIKNLNYALTPGRYIGLPDDEDDFNFAERFTSLKAELEAQIAEEEDLNKRIANNLSKITLPNPQ